MADSDCSYKQLKAGLASVHPCPVNSGCETKMQRMSFIRSCIDNREQAYRVNNGFNNNWKKNTIYTCTNCDTGTNVEIGCDFKIPDKIKFIRLDPNESVPKRKEYGYKRKTTLNAKLVMEIREKSKNGITSKELANLYRVTVRTINSVIRRETWYNI